MTAAAVELESKSQSSSYRSTHSSRSSVLERAREYTRKMDDDATPASTPRSHSAGRSSKISRDSRQPPATPSSQVRSSTPRTQQGSQATRPSARGQQQRNPPEEQEAVVSPELLVDALSGQEDGLLAIAERLMEHYDRGYDAMGEAIIDAFADVQKLFQHVVEAAHMEGAAFEASRREEEMQELRKRADGQLLDTLPPEDADATPAGPVRHDEFIDQDVKDCLTEAIKQGASLKDAGQHQQCYDLYEQACQSASALLPVDSDHRGRLQLSIARAESMNPDRGCAILRYAMDDVLRSGLRAGQTPLPDPSKRADVVLSKPKVHPSMNAASGSAGVVQSSEEQLNSLVEEMKEILAAPVYKDTPLQDVAKRFWGALNETQKHQNKNEERLEQSLGKLKGDFLLARAEWEEKLHQSEAKTEQFKQKYMSLKQGQGPATFMADARTNMSRGFSSVEEDDKAGALPRGMGSRGGAESIASLGSSMAQHARTLVGQFACTTLNDRNGPVLATELAEQGTTAQQRYGHQEWRQRSSARNQGAAPSFREYAPAHRSVDV
eukprot:Nitzschia sp. Nitz4//scaffold390_size11914//8569//10291//NITZ4_009015-RA/size11914-snap-gene-0.13-mRNA-1//1//CDS//3329550189//4372//frame0